MIHNVLDMNFSFNNYTQQVVKKQFYGRCAQLVCDFKWAPKVK